MTHHKIQMTQFGGTMADDYMVRMNDLEAAEKLKVMAKMDKRTIGDQNAWIIHQMWALRTGLPAAMMPIIPSATVPDITSGEAK